ncbi:ATP-binding cassette subfamily B multidrug efflux pump [Catenulispora sp. EB89]|uniref:ABC transporter ATP-binding protein n=1 Tax=Catenulispora sp. EB89 TaxID=3156257 RepID=UPI003518691B
MTEQTIEAPADFRQSARRMYGLLGPKRRLSGVAALGVGSIALNVSGPWLLGHATDLVFHGRHGSDLAWTLVAAVLAYAGSGACWILQGRLTTRVVQKAMFSLRAEVADKLARLPLSYLDGRTRGEVLSRTTNDIDNVAQGLQQTLSQITNSSLLLVGVLGMMFWISPLLSVVAIVAVPLSMYLTKVLGARAQRRFDEQWKITGTLNARVEETYSAYSLIKLLGRKQEIVASFREENEALYQASARAQFMSGLIGPVTTVIGNASYVVVAVVGGFRLASGALSVGEVQAFIQYSRQFTQPLMAVASLANLVQSGVASSDRVFEFLAAPEEDRDSSAQLHEPVQGLVSFENVSFRYSPDRPLIEDLSFTVRPGRSVAIVGPTGAGKTTLVNLLMRFYDITAGRITVDGTDIRDVDRDALRSRLGMVLQDTWLFHGTVEENIGYGRPGATADQIRQAARDARVDHLIRTLPNGYQTVVDAEGTGLSVGERQLITIARAVLADPAILLLDEATSSVDTRTELLIQEALTRLAEGRTSFVIAHRLSTVQDADVILVMTDGAIVEQGTHTELLAAEGAYARLHAAQFAHTTPTDPTPQRMVP